MNFLNKYENESYALLRITSGAMFAFHGVQKVLGLFTDKAMDFGSQLWIGGLIELVAGILIAIGFKTRFAAFLSSGTMAVAYTQFHWKLSLGEQIFPAINRGELALLYSFAFLFIAAKGSGIWSIEKS